MSWLCELPRYYRRDLRRIYGNHADAIFLEQAIKHAEAGRNCSVSASQLRKLSLRRSVREGMKELRRLRGIESDYLRRGDLVMLRAKSQSC